MNTLYSALIAPMQRTRVDVFENIFLVFLGLGTLVGIVVVAYTLYNAYKYRDTGEPAGDDEDLPSVGELPTGGKGGKKLFLSFGISAVIVISLVIWTYGMLLYVEDPGTDDAQDSIEVEVTGEGFAWFYEYENGIEASGTLRVPAGDRVWLQVTSGDVWHNFGIPDQRVKADAIPGEYDKTWFQADEPGESEIECFELCGEYHTSMVGTLQVMEEDEFDQWMDNQLTMQFTMVDGNESRVTEGYELTLEHQENDSIEDRSFTAEEFDNGTIEITDIEQAGQYNVTIESTNGQFETVEDQFDMTGPVDETYTLEMNESESNASETNDGGEN
ncbi:cytochrome c oxidase, subunit II [Natrinema pellirubrum DSM 15624]|uniref:Cytochrome c oxidase, subunit II n=1 Tax=Natrinema pellirubrum (strain DSM 15624 / CIP 106293 / JCM 10476 / NCIMB 786 / 157) TaxID=797303 RepID=L0JKE7_NATP1|nr:cytochrome c oxidase subunit II [Natrinema pellirubrum]AGB30816.1 cytochrome c oxidase, subunit II [Natrinema pellirubrum DSM 15624]ELY80798.1 cytochrome c oxidase, subunit II [Natrinema pellirubrum DSM 15624]